jgi:hypothetical protein
MQKSIWLNPKPLHVMDIQQTKKRKLLSLITSIFRETTASIRLKDFSLRSGMRKGSPLTTPTWDLTISHIQGNSARKRTEIREGKIKLKLFTGNMITKIENLSLSGIKKENQTNIEWVFQSQRIQNQYIKISHHVVWNEPNSERQIPCFP